MRTSRYARMIQTGTTTVEFALISVVFFMLLIGIMEFGRVLFYWNSAEEAARLGARIAVVCDMNDGDIKVKMREMFPRIGLNDINVEYRKYDPALGLQPCAGVDDCDRVTVSINPGVAIATYIPFVSLGLTLPPFTTSLPRESMKSTNGPAGAETNNPVCS